MTTQIYRGATNARISVTMWENSNLKKKFTCETTNLQKLMNSKFGRSDKLQYSTSAYTTNSGPSSK